MRPDATLTLQDALNDPAAFPQPTSQIKRIETHMSWIFLAGDYAYKVKKPIHFDFVDFSTLRQREFFCREELRLNVAFAPQLYLDVVPVVRYKSGVLLIDPELKPKSKSKSKEEGDIVEWAVKMRRFDTTQQADVLVEENRASISQFAAFGRLLANQHALLTRVMEPPSLRDAVIENFKTLASLDCCISLRSQLDALRVIAEKELQVNAGLLQERASKGYIRNCHGDLHLSNMVAVDGALQAFDCLEFSKELRSIDVWNDVAFLLMDCDFRGRANLAYACIDGYLEAGADYWGLQLLPLYARYRSMVRAKVSALALDQQLKVPTENSTEVEKQKLTRARMEAHVHWAEHNQKRPPGTLLITCGLSGSGKSYWAKQLVPELTALRLRTDVYRKQRAGLSPRELSDSGLNRGLYAAGQTDDVYSELAQLCATLLASGETVIADAACLKESQRTTLIKAAEKVGARAIVLHMQASVPELMSRIKARRGAATDPSEADEAVLKWQLANQQPPSPGPQVLAVDTETIDCSELLRAISAMPS